MQLLPYLTREIQNAFYCTLWKVKVELITEENFICNTVRILFYDQGIVSIFPGLAIRTYKLDYFVLYRTFTVLSTYPHQ